MPALTRRELYDLVWSTPLVGALIHRVLKDQEDRCERYSVGQLPRMGQKAPACYEMMGRCLGLLDAFSSCAWKCSEGDHILERLIVRANNSARGALRLALMGFYDESLSLLVFIVVTQFANGSGGVP